MSAKLHKKEKRNQRMRAWPVKHETAQGLQESQRGKKGLTLGEWVPTVVVTSLSPGPEPLSSGTSFGISSCYLGAFGQVPVSQFP